MDHFEYYYDVSGLMKRADSGDDHEARAESEDEEEEKMTPASRVTFTRCRVGLRADVSERGPRAWSSWASALGSSSPFPVSRERAGEGLTSAS